MIRVLVSASSAVIRAGLESLVRAAPNLELATSEADVALVETDEHLSDLPRDPPVVVLTGAPASEALRAGARSILPRDATPAEILAAIEAAAAGLITLHPADLNALLTPARAESAAEPGEALTPRELDVFAMLAEGAGNKTIAWKLGISEHTVKFHVASIMSKLSAASRTEAVAIGVRRGLIML